MNPVQRTSVTAVVAAYLPDPALASRLARLAPQVNRIVLVDDGSGPEADPVLRQAEHQGTQVLRLDANRGIAAALNAGVHAALEDGADAVLTLDQDSSVDDGYVAAALGALERVQRAGRPLAIAAAGMQSGQLVRPVRYDDRGHAVTPTLEAIQSGLLIPAAVVARLGDFDERLFIDCVDTDFVLRAASAGVPTYLVRDCRLEHPLGRLIETGTRRATRSGRRSFAYHPAWRRYYISRNRVVVLARHGAHRPDWAALGLVGEAVQLARCLVFGPEKLRQSAAVVLGVADAVRGRRGKLVGAGAALLGAPR